MPASPPGSAATLASDPGRILRPRALSLLLAVLIVAVLAATAGVASGAPDGATSDDATSDDAAADGPRIVSIYPNPHAAGDPGEFVVVEVPAGVEGTVELTDGRAAVAVEVRGRPVAFSSEPGVARNHTDVPVRAAPGLRLADEDERLRLRRGDRVLDAVAYEDAPEGERWVRSAPADRRWRPLGLDHRPIRSFGPANVTAFVTPDAPGPPLAALRGADDRILLAGYTLTSRRVVHALLAARDRGVEVRVLLEAQPVGGMSDRQAARLDRLAAAGVPVRLAGGDGRGRFATHHPKYAVVDETALVTTENWKPSGVGGRSSRGWGVSVRSPAVAADLADLFAADWAARGAVGWERFRTGRSFVEADAAEGRYPAEFDPAELRADRVRVLTAPGNAEAGLVDAIDGADERVDVIQPTIGDETALLAACRRAAERGVRVRILLSDAWYVGEENRALAERLNAHADRRDLPLAVRLADPGDRYGKVHAKGVLIDGETVVLGSLNWNRVAARENREVLVALDGEPAAYYRRVFEADWEGDGGGLPLGLPVAVLAAGVVVAWLVRRRIAFEGGGREAGTDPLRAPERRLRGGDGPPTPPTGDDGEGEEG